MASPPPPPPPPQYPSYPAPPEQEVPGGELLPQLHMPPPGHQNRLTVLLRLLLLIPHLVLLAFFSVGAFFVTIAGWFSALVLGRLPDPVHRFLSCYVGYDTRVNAGTLLLTDRYPPFRARQPRDFPVLIEVVPVRLNRLAVLFRIILMIPAVVVEGVAWAGWWSICVILWLVVLVMGRMPEPLFEATAAILRYRMRTGAYVMMLTSAYPKGLYGDRRAPAHPAGEGTAGAPGPYVPYREPAPYRSATRPLLLRTGGTVLLTLFLVLGVLSYVFNGSGNRDTWRWDDGGTTRAGTAALP